MNTRQGCTVHRALMMDGKQRAVRTATTDAEQKVATVVHSFLVPPEGPNVWAIKPFGQSASEAEGGTSTYETTDLAEALHGIPGGDGAMADRTDTGGTQIVGGRFPSEDQTVTYEATLDAPGPPTRVALNSRFLLGLLNGSAGEVSIGWAKTNSKPIIVQTDTTRAIIMPVRTEYTS